MENRKQQTIQQPVQFSGKGLHTGCSVNITLKPAKENHGIHFHRVDLPGKPDIKAVLSNIQTDVNLQRCTTIGKGEAVIHTVEHLLSVLCGIGIDNLDIDIDGIEVPGLDGSGLEFLKGIKGAGIVEQSEPYQFYEIKEPVGVELNGCSLFITPAKDFKISYTLDYNHPQMRSQFVQVSVDPNTFETEIAPSRTFCMESEAKDLLATGLGKGADYNNTLVVGEQGVLKNTVRFKDEFARHKVLDFIGDLFLLGMPIRGHVFAVKSGHTLNLKLLKKIHEQKSKYSFQSHSIDAVTSKKEIDIEGIMNVLPHRYPFLLVDRVIDIEKGKRGVGIKNVTINDGFFQGHFPTRPVMPGVMMIEAMAQTAGVVILTNEVHHGKLAFFMSVDNVKFRKVVTPGDQMLMEVNVVRDRSRTAQIHAKATVKGELVCEADMVFSYTDESFLY
ncbi:MAG: bifunctional UDP-3-O-[3-hydroxymyristoyl] N-acetylglucosamine deacetylase/3-hydroxyacyl-ACP dehydratase [Candidatus Omnitrophica bacterium]|nr:bifunctional UDP-3-O-[3-hydroxymyristoyl] N-acetylglucosamine deacetylase/3-hydroxyacyl-ACP dehydratase [Candidatus Omnitrophota bacterium]